MVEPLAAVDLIVAVQPHVLVVEKFAFVKDHGLRSLPIKSSNLYFICWYNLKMERKHNQNIVRDTNVT